MQKDQEFGPGCYLFGFFWCMFLVLVVVLIIVSLRI